MAEFPDMFLVATSPGTSRVLSDLKLWQCTPLCLPQASTAVFNSARPASSAASEAQIEYLQAATTACNWNVSVDAHSECLSAFIKIPSAGSAEHNSMLIKPKINSKHL